jgi:hypothetical protein
MSDPVLREFRYRFRPFQLILVAVLQVGALGLFIFFTAHPEPAKVRGIELTALQVQVITGAVSVILAVFIVFWIAFAAANLRHVGRVALTASTIILPKPNWRGVSGEEIELRFEEITSVKVLPFVAREVMLQIIHRGGKVCVFSNMFPNRREFDLLAELVATAVDNACFAAWENGACGITSGT